MDNVSDEPTELVQLPANWAFAVLLVLLLWLPVLALPNSDEPNEPGGALADCALPLAVDALPDTLSGVASFGGVGGKLNKCGLEWEEALGACATPMPGGLL